MKRFLLSAALLLACSGVALAQESEFSGGGGGGITAAPGSGTANVLPRFVSGTSLADSKWTMSGTNLGTATLYDDTATIGVSRLSVVDGAGQGATAQIAFGPTYAGGGASFYARPTSAYVDVQSRDGSVYVNLAANGFFTAVNEYSGAQAILGSGVQLKWSNGSAYWNGTPDAGVARAAEGIVRATNGSTGDGGFQGVSIQGASSTALSAATPTAFVDIPVASGARIGGVIEYCVEADDGTDFQIESGVIQFVAVNKAGTVTTTSPTATGTPLQVCNSGTLTAAFTATAGSGKITINCDAASSLPVTTLRIRYRVHVNSSTAAIVVTPL